MNNLSVNANGHEYVDLALPSGTLWATCNVGAQSPEESGTFFAWGETKPKKVYTGENYFDKPKGEAQFRGYSLESKWTLAARDDAACVNMGGDWRMPTVEQFRELGKYCDCIKEEINGKSIMRFTSKRNGRNLVFVANKLANSVWTNHINAKEDGEAWSLCSFAAPPSRPRYKPGVVRGCITPRREVAMQWIDAKKVQPRDGQHVIALMAEWQGNREVRGAWWFLQDEDYGEDADGNTVTRKYDNPHFEDESGGFLTQDEVEYWMPVPSL